MIESISDQVIQGYNIVGSNNRKITGVATKSSNGYKLIFVEPGDDEYDGQFEITLALDEGAAFLGEGTWKSFNGELNRLVKIERLTP